MIRFKITTAAALLLLLTPLSTYADTCSRINVAYSPCQLSTMCSLCITTSGCEYNLMDGTCTSVAATNSSVETTYCSDSDSVCASCSVSSSKPACTGQDGSCICPSMCDIVSSDECSGSGSTATAVKTSDSQNFSIMYLAVALGALCIMIMLYMQRRCAERRVEHRMSLIRQELESRRQQRRREREMLRARRPELALNLETWRDHVEVHKPQMSKVELETCYYLMMQDEKKNGKKKGSDHYDSASEGEVKIAIGAVSSPIASSVVSPSHMSTPYFPMREEYPSNTTTDGSDSGSERGSVASQDEEKPKVAIDMGDADQSSGRSLQAAVLFCGDQLEVASTMSRVLAPKTIQPIRARSHVKVETWQVSSKHQRQAEIPPRRCSRQPVGYSPREAQIPMRSLSLIVFTLFVLLPVAVTMRLRATIPASSTCTYINSKYSACKVNALCSLCITSEGCKFNVDNLSCETKSAAATANGTATSYCSSDDTVCSTCIVTAAYPICRGDDGTCICQNVCSAVKPAVLSHCSDMEGSIIMYIGIALGMILVFAFALLMVKCRQRYYAVLRQRSLASQRRRESELLRMRQPHLVLNLVGWRDTIDVDKLELHKLDACSYVANKDQAAAIVVDDDELNLSMETTSTLSEVESPQLSGPGCTSPSAASSCLDSGCAYSAMDDITDCNGREARR